VDSQIEEALQIPRMATGRLLLNLDVDLTILQLFYSLVCMLIGDRGEDGGDACRIDVSEQRGVSTRP
jgi:hypothetical protein